MNPSAFCWNFGSSIRRPVRAGEIENTGMLMRSDGRRKGPASRIEVWCAAKLSETGTEITPPASLHHSLAVPSPRRHGAIEQLHCKPLQSINLSWKRAKIIKFVGVNMISAATRIGRQSGETSHRRSELSRGVHRIIDVRLENVPELPTFSVPLIEAFGSPTSGPAFATATNRSITTTPSGTRRRNEPVAEVNKGNAIKANKFKMPASFASASFHHNARRAPIWG